MTNVSKTLMLLCACVLVGAGCNVTVNSPSETSQMNSNVTLYKHIEIGGVVEVAIPENCVSEGAAGSTYVTCPTPENENPAPEFVASSDGSQVNFRRGDGPNSDVWEYAIKSLRVVTPLDRAIQINIEQ